MEVITQTQIGKHQNLILKIKAMDLSIKGRTAVVTGGDSGIGFATAKILAINGSKDVQVFPTENLNGIEKALKKSKSPFYTTAEIEGLNHLFQTCKTCKTGEYAQLEETFSPVAIKVMTDWLQKNVLTN